MYRRYIKRVLDFVAALVGLVVLSPLLLVVWVWLTIANKGSGAMFTQERPGKDEKIFKLYKFKSMTDERDAEGNLLPDAQRLTKVGRFVRKTSLDELPQFWNVLRGDMSFIGPRPLTTDYLLVLNGEQKKRHNVRPGITGLAQVKGRGNCKLSKKFKYDTMYVDNLNLFIDLKILFLTMFVVLRREDVGKGSDGMEDVDDLGFSERMALIKSRK
ncbi:sugar transferase [Porphyromonas levii]|uniref:sugar transferase n=1 Tax=Porphyromonas levii TaxID=28114 RepID=UPI001B8C13D3|nr:sugar transferase [Porphyromonas levii]MBR8759078.1 Undecaprenyl phosphate N,N'-diacetylbacillosamine 1-phosphate transferase [Porphyromonas levii]MBR8762956.1 Undecaprenyl phosphate N,N'-diacetylbacillosamine 1-phosphate transferase [Porphyromonas levii]